MKSCLDKLLTRADHEQVLQVIDTSLSLVSTSYELIDYTVAELAPLLPMPDQSARGKCVCVLENRDSAEKELPALRQLLTHGEPKAVSSLEFGNGLVYSWGKNTSIVVDRVGTFFHDGEGRFLVLIDSNRLVSSSRNRLNIQGVLNLLLGETLALSSRSLVHAGGSGTENGCRLWTGESGSGKTTQTLLRVMQGADFYGDDQVIIGPGPEGDWHAWPFWRSMKIHPNSWRMLPGLSFLREDGDLKKEKQVIADIRGALEVEKPSPAKIEEIILLVPNATGIYRQLNLNEAFARVAPCFLHGLLPGNLIRSMDNLLDLFSEVDVFEASWDMVDRISG